MLIFFVIHYKINYNSSFFIDKNTIEKQVLLSKTCDLADDFQLNRKWNR